MKNFSFKKLLTLLNLKFILTKTVAMVLVGVIILPIWISGYLFIVLSIKDALGYSEEIIFINGRSMFPTFPKREGKDPKKYTQKMLPYPNGLLIAGKRFFNYEIGRGDIVVVENDKIKEITKKIYGEPSGWIKRVIALPGNSIELRGGIVYLNNKPLKEPYTAQPRSTFGQNFLSECKKNNSP